MFIFQKRFALVLLLMVAFIDELGIGLVYPMFSSMIFDKASPFMAHDASDAVRGSYLGILLALGPLLQFFSAPVLGTLSDTHGRKKVLLSGLSIGIVGYLIAAAGVYLHSLPVLFISRVLVGISMGTMSVAHAAIADISLSEEKAKHFSWLSMACGVGFAIGPYVGGKLSDPTLVFGGLDKPFLLGSIMILCNYLLIRCCFAETAPTKEKAKISYFSGLTNITKAASFTGLRAIFLATLVYCFGWSFYWEFIPATWMSLYAFTPADVGAMYAYGAAFYAGASAFIVPFVTSRFRVALVMFYSFFAAAFSILMMLNISPEEFLVYIPFQQLFLALLFPTAMSIVSNSVADDVQGETLGILHSIFALAFALSPIVSGPLLGVTLRMPIIIGGISFVLAGVIFGIGFRKEIFGVAGKAKAQDGT